MPQAVDRRFKKAERRRPTDRTPQIVRRRGKKAERRRREEYAI
jgi:hypothetical protein